MKLTPRGSSSETREKPRIPFVGVFDTVKATNDDYLHDISSSGTVQYYRHAMALNETRKSYAVQEFGSYLHNASKTDQSIIEAWFIGAHSDLGGANLSHGLSLYPLHWILTEASNVGLHLGFEALKFPMSNVDNMLEIIYPRNEGQSINSEPHNFQLSNGISIKMHDFRSAHRSTAIIRADYSIKLNQARALAYFMTLQKRSPFLTNGELEGLDPFGKAVSAD